MTAKTRKEELIELLDPKGKVVTDIHDTIIELKNSTNQCHEQVCWKALDMKLDTYINLRVEKTLLDIKENQSLSDRIVPVESLKGEDIPNISNNVRDEIYDILTDAGIDNPTVIVSEIMNASVVPAFEAVYAAGKAKANSK